MNDDIFPAPPGRFRRAVGAVAAALGLGIVFVGSALVALGLHLDRPVSHRVVRDVANRVLGSVFEGRLEVGEIEHVGIDGADIRTVTAFDPRGAPTLHASRLRARLDVVALLRDLLVGEGDLEIDIPFARLEDADVLVEPGPAGRLTIEETFSPRPSPAVPTPAPARPGRVVRVALRHIELGHGSAHGAIAPPQSLDGEVWRAVASLRVGPRGVALDVEPTGVAERALAPAPIQGSLDYHLRVPSDRPVAMWTNGAAQLGAIEVQGRATLVGGVLDARVEVPRATPEQLATVVRGLPVQRAVSGFVNLTGPIPRFELAAHLAFDDDEALRGGLDVQGALDATGPFEARFDVDARGVDLRTFGALLPEARVTGSGRAKVRVVDGGPSVIVEAATAPTTMEGRPVPAADLYLVYDRGLLSGSATLHEPGIATHGTFVAPSLDEIRFEAQADVPSIAAAPRIAGPVQGGASVRVAGRMSRGRLDADFTGRVAALRTGSDFALDHGEVRGRIEGPLDALAVDASVRGSGVHAAGKSYATVDLHARGPVFAPRITTKLTDPFEGQIDADARLDVARKTAVDVHVRVQRNEGEVHGTIGRISAGAGGVEVSEIQLEGGVGKVAGTLRVQQGELVGRLKGDGVDVGQVARLVGVPFRVRGIADVDVVLERNAKGRTGHVLVQLEQGEVPMVPGISANVAVRFEDDEVEADGLLRIVAEDAATTDLHASEEALARACSGTIATLRLSHGKGSLPGHLLDRSSWLGVVGEVEIAAEDWNLRCLSRLFPVGLPVTEVRGTASAKTTLARSQGDRFPSIRDLSMRTRGLAVVGPQGAHDEEPVWSSTALDVSVRGSLDGTTGRTLVSVTTFDDAILAELSVATTLDLPALTGGKAALWPTLAAAPVTAALAIPRRAIGKLTSLPTPIAGYVPAMAGDVAVEAWLDGSLAKPVVEARFAGYGLATQETTDAALGAFDEPGAWSLPIDVDGSARYDGAAASLSAEAKRTGRVIAKADAQIDAPLSRMTSPVPTGEPAWSGSARLSFLGLPLGEIPALADGGVTGGLRGDVVMKDLGTAAPSLTLDLAVPDLAVDDVPFETAALKASILPSEDAPPTGIVTLSLVRAGGGRLDATGYGGVVWQAGLVPTLDTRAPADLHAKAKAMPLGAAHPLVADVLSKLDGLVDGELRVGWNRLDEGEAGAVDVSLEVRNGSFHVPQIGQEFKSARVSIKSHRDPAHPDEMTVVELAGISADGISGTIAGKGRVRLDGLSFHDAEADLAVAQGSELPLTLEGVPLGRAKGSVHLTADREPGTVTLHIEVPNLDLALPPSPGKGVQPLEEAADVHVSHPLGPPQRPRPPDALRWVLEVALGKVRVEGSGVSLTLGSPRDRATAKALPLRIVLTDEARITGDIQIGSGRIEAFGRDFNIEQGILRMRSEDASNPFLNVSAYWDSPRGTRVYVDYVGLLNPVTKDKIKFRSSPPMPEASVMALLLGGDESAAPEGAAGQRGQGDLTTGVTGGVASAMSSELLSRIGPRGFSTRIGTTEEGNLKTSVVYELDDSLTAQATFEDRSTAAEAGATATTESAAPAADATTRRTEVSIDWRFHKNWSVRGTVGVGKDASSGVDLLWQYRY